MALNSPPHAGQAACSDVWIAAASICCRQRGQRTSTNAAGATSVIYLASTTRVFAAMSWMQVFSLVKNAVM